MITKFTPQNVYGGKTRQELSGTDIIDTLNTLQEAFVEIESEFIRYVQIQESSEGGYDYTLFDYDGEEIDGGIRETDDDALMGNEETGEYTIKRIMSEEEGEAILEGEYDRLFS